MMLYVLACTNEFNKRYKATYTCNPVKTSAAVCICLVAPKFNHYLQQLYFGYN